MHHLYQTIKRSALISVLGVMLLQACGPLQIQDTQTGHWVAFQTGTVELHRDILIASERTRAFFQNGTQVPRINEFKPFCQLELNRLQEQPQMVRPDSFIITQVGGKTEQVVAINGILLASLDNTIAHLGGSDTGPQRVTEILYFRLHSDRQPDVRELACGGAFDSPGNARAPTVQEIAGALGENATLVLR